MVDPIGDHKPGQPLNKNLIIIVSIVAVVAIFGISATLWFLSQTRSSTQTTGAFGANPILQQEKTRAACTFECCINSPDYVDKLCQPDYECQNFRCVAIDTDKDGLPDYEEKQLGTNPSNPDTDGDTLNDYQEVKVLHTNPLSRNTDNDRYDDNVDPNPTKVNSANIVISKNIQKGEYNFGNIIKDSGIIALATGGLGACTGFSFGTCAAAVPSVLKLISPILEDEIYKTDAQITFSNKGDDYTSYVKYDVVFSINITEVARISQDTGRLDIDQVTTVPFSYSIKFKDIQYGRTWDLIFGKSKINMDVTNVNYEHFGV